MSEQRYTPQALRRIELVVDPRTKRVRQAGTIDPVGAYVLSEREIYERDLYEFTSVVLERDYLTPTLHRPVCEWLQRRPPVRKMLLLPRRHAKTSIVSHGLPPHILIQPRDHNIYLPGRLGADTRIMLAGEVATRAQNNMRVIRHIFERNDLFRALWPHLVWQNPGRDAEKWNQEMLVVPRETHYPDPSITANGVGGQITGARHDVHIKDDLISEAAANSQITMHSAIQWHINSRALLDSQDESLEFIIGTRWQVQDLYSFILQEDPTVDYVVRSIIEDGKPIYPEVFDLEGIDQLRKQAGVRFALIYMNSVGDPSLVDFSEDYLRFFDSDGSVLTYGDDIRDVSIERKIHFVRNSVNAPPPGTPLTAENVDAYYSGKETYFRFQAN